jgi:hypothetical protein
MIVIALLKDSNRFYRLIRRFFRRTGIQRHAKLPGNQPGPIRLKRRIMGLKPGARSDTFGREIPGRATLVRRGCPWRTPRTHRRLARDSRQKAKGWERSHPAARFPGAWLALAALRASSGPLPWACSNGWGRHRHTARSERSSAVPPSCFPWSLLPSPEEGRARSRLIIQRLLQDDTNVAASGASCEDKTPFR